MANSKKSEPDSDRPNWHMIESLMPSRSRKQARMALRALEACLWWGRLQSAKFFRPLKPVLYASLTTFLLFHAAAYAADNPTALLQQRCGTCHSDTAHMSGLSVSTREALLKGGARGTALVPGKSAESLLYKAIAHQGDLAMPPGTALDPAQVETLKNWIDEGAPWSSTHTPAQSTWWAFRKPIRPAVPTGAANPIDAFIDAKLATAHLHPAPQADRLTLIRRAAYDLTGLPPTKAQIDAFLADQSPQAWEHVIDQFLASPRYGEKWARHWLDLARYGDTAGFEQDPYLLLAWRYRDYVIKSFNDDKPYDRFTKEQIAADELYPNDPEARTGTGFYRVGTNRDMLFKVEDANLVEKRIDMVDTTGAVFLGLTVGCARCHDHKFDPIPQKDYYRLQAIFQPAVSDKVFLDYNPARNYDIAENNRTFKLWQIGEEIAAINRKYQPPLDPKDPNSKPRKQSEIDAMMSQADRERLEAISKRLLQTFSNYAPPPMSAGIIDAGRDAPKTFIAIRGNPESYGEEVQPGFPSCTGGGDVPEAPLHATSTLRRKALAEWIATPDNPLFARVMVNRIWQFHFGEGLEKTPSDFGIRGGLPTHPELLDWLATEFAAKNWSIKSMHKLIMMSAAYQRSANPSPEAAKNDPANDLLSHFNRRRLEAEEIRDASLQVTGELNLKMGGVPIVPPLSKEEMFGMIGNPASAWMVTPDTTEHKRRSIYLISRRTFQQPMSQAFDGPDGVLTCPRRNESTTAPQSLALLNSAFTMDRAKALASKTTTPESAWEQIYGRAPNAEEKAAAAAFLQKATMTDLIRALMNTNEFLYVD